MKDEEVIGRLEALVEYLREQQKALREEEAKYQNPLYLSGMNDGLDHAKFKIKELLSSLKTEQRRLDKIIAEQAAIMGPGWHDLVDAAAEAEEQVEIDELERFAEEQRRCQTQS